MTIHQYNLGSLTPTHPLTDGFVYVDPSYETVEIFTVPQAESVTFSFSSGYPAVYLYDFNYQYQLIGNTSGILQPGSYYFDIRYAYDNSNGYDLGSVTISATAQAVNHTPTATPHNQTAAPGTVIPLSTLFTYSDADGLSDIVTLDVQDRTAGGGHLTYNGVTQADNTVWETPISQIGLWSYVVGPSGSVDTVGFNVTDRAGAFNTSVTATVTAQTVNHTPTATPHNQTAAPGTVIPLSTLFTYSDADGLSDIVTLDVQDRTAGGGHLTYNGVTQADNTVWETPISQIGLWSYVVGPSGSVDTVGFNVTDRAGAFNTSVTATVTAQAVNHTPTATPHNQTAAPGTVIPLSTLFTYSDADGLSDIVTLDVQDRTAGGGHLTYNGVTQADNTVWETPISQIGLWSYVVGPSGSVDTVGFNVTDRAGAFNTSVTATVTAQTVNHTPTATPHNQTAAPGTVIPLSTLFTYSDADGLSDIVTLDVQDRTAGGGHLTYNGVTQADNTVWETPISQIGLWSYVVGPSGSVDTVGFNVTDRAGAFNTSVTATVTAQTVNSDLKPTSLSLGSSSVSEGGSLGVYWTISNIGSGSAPATTTGIRITSSSTDHGTASNTVTNVSTPALTSGAYTPESTTITASTTPGTYYVWVVADNSNPATGNQGTNTANDYQLAGYFKVTADTIPNDTSTTHPLNVGSSVSSSIDTSDVNGSTPDKDWFQVTLAAGHRYEFTDQGTSGTLNLVAIRLYSNNTTTVSALADNSTALDFTPTTSGTYYLAVSAGGSNFASKTGNYTVTLTDLGLVDTVLDTKATSGTLAVGTTINDVINSAPMSGSGDKSYDHDWFKVVLTAGHSYTFSAQGTSGNLNDVAIDLRNSSGTQITGLVDPGANTPAVLNYTPSTSSTYFLALSAGGNNPASLTGSYSLSLKDNGAPGTTDNLLDNVNTSGALTSFATGTIDAEPKSGSTTNVSDGQGGLVDKDWFKVTLAKGNIYTFSADGISIGTGLVDISLYGQNGTQVHTPVEGKDPSFTVDTTLQADAQDIYYIAVSAGGADPAWRTATGDYSVSLSAQTATATPDTIPGSILTKNTLVANAPPITGTIDSADINGGADDDYYKVTLKGGEKYQFIASAGVSSSDSLDSVFIRLHDAQGNVVPGNESASGANPSFDFSVPGTGSQTYYLAISASSVGSSNGVPTDQKTGQYSISLVDQGSALTQPGQGAAAPLTGLHINLIPDRSVLDLPGGQNSPFALAVQYAADLIEQYLGNITEVTLNIRYGWGTYNNDASPGLLNSGGAEGNALLGEAESYATVYSWLQNSSRNFVDLQAIAGLPNTDSVNGASSIWVTSAQEKALGKGQFANQDDPSNPDGAVGFGTAAGGSYDLWVEEALHEITHAMGRLTQDLGVNGTPLIPLVAPTILDLYRYDSNGFQWDGTKSAYFSMDGGTTPSAYFDTTSDYADWAINNYTNNPPDPFNYSANAAGNSLTTVDKQVLGVLGFDRAPSCIVSSDSVQGTPLVGDGGVLELLGSLLNAGTNLIFGTQGTNGVVLNALTGDVQTVFSQFSELLFNGGAFKDIVKLLPLTAAGVAHDTVYFNGNNGDDTLDGSAADTDIVASGGNGNDILIGGAQNDILDGGPGNDKLTGGGGEDTASYASATAAVTVSLLLQGVAQNTKGAGIDTLNGISDLLGGSGNDTLIGDSNDNVLNGNSGNDTLIGGLGSDTLIGGGGIDTASYQNDTAGVTVDLTLSGAQSGGEAQGDILSGISNLIGGSGDDVLTGDANANVLVGGAGNDTIEGGGGNDTIDGGVGIDTAVFSGARSDYDLIRGKNGTFTITDLRTGSPDGTDTLKNVELLQFSDGVIDATTIPTVTAVAGTPNSGSVGAGQTVVIDLTTSKAIDVSGLPTLTLSDRGIATYDAGNSDPANGKLEFDYVAQAGQNTGSATLKVSSLSLGKGVTITDLAGNALNVAGAAKADLGVTVDTIAPAVKESLKTDTGSSKTDKFTSDATLTGSGDANATVHFNVDGSDIAGTAPADGKGLWTILGTDLSLGDGSHTIIASETDAAGNVGQASLTFTLDSTAPTVQGVSSTPASGSAIGLNHTAIIKLDMGEALKVTGAPTLTLSDGETATYLAASSNLASGILAFSYKAAANHLSPDLQIDPIVLAKGIAVTDLAGNAADFTLTGAQADLGLSVDTTPPTVTAVSSTTAAGTRVPLGGINGAPIEIDVHTSEDVFVNGSGLTLKLSDGGTATYVSGSGSQDLIFDYTPALHQNTPDLKVTALTLVKGSTITDLAGNAIIVTGAANKDLGIIVDTNVPTVSAVALTPPTPGAKALASGDDLIIKLTVKDATTGDSLNVTGTPALTLNDGDNAVYDAADSSGNVLAFKYTVGNESTTDLKIGGFDFANGTVTDLAGNSIAAVAANLADLKLTANVYTWAHGVNGDWNTGSNWTPQAVPTDGNTALITAAGTYTVTSGQANSVAMLNMRSTATLAVNASTFDVTGGTGTGALAGKINVNDGATLGFGAAATNTSFNNTGAIALMAGAAATDLVIAGNVTLAGAGKLTLSDSVNNAIASDGSAATLTNGDTTAGNTIMGAGTIGDATLTLFNEKKGTINGNGINNELTLDTGTNTITNQGILEGTTAQGLVVQSDVANSNLIEAFGTGARLDLLGSTITNTALAVILASGAAAHVEVDGATIIGGTLKTTGINAVIDVVNGSATLDGSGSHPVSNAGSLVVDDAAALTLLGTLNNTGAITLNAGADPTNLTISGEVTLNGAGKVILSDVNDQIVSDGSSASLTNNSNILGAGTIGDSFHFLDFSNGTKGIVNADLNGHALTVDTHSFSNAGILEATGQGVLLLESDITDTATAQVKAAGAGAHIDLDGITISGGKVSTVAGSLIEAINNTTPSTVSGATVSNAGTLGAEGGDLTIAGAVNNTGKLDANGHHLTIEGAVTGSGSGTIEAGGTLEFGAASSAKITFTDDGALIFDTATNAANKFTGTLTGFAAGDHIDLEAINFDPLTTHLTQSFATATGGTVNVTDAQNDSITLHFLGDYTHQAFQILDDNTVNHHVDLLLV